MMSLDQEQTDENLKDVYDMVDDDNSGVLDKEEVALVIELFSSACLCEAGWNTSIPRFHQHPSPGRHFCMPMLRFEPRHTISTQTVPVYVYGCR
eukprot:COSAG02_NODE_3963_length_5980_cov_16.337528_8_plen_94_part_00